MENKTEIEAVRALLKQATEKMEGIEWACNELGYKGIEGLIDRAINKRNKARGGV